MARLVLPTVLTHAQAAGAARMLAQALRASSQRHAVVDASALEHFDSSALAVLLDTRRDALALGMTFAVAAMPARLRALASMYGVQSLLPDEGSRSA